MPTRRFLCVAFICPALALGGCSSAKTESGEEATSRVGFDVWKAFAGTPDRIAQLLQPRSSAATVFKPTLSDEITKIYDNPGKPRTT